MVIEQSDRLVNKFHAILVTVCSIIFNLAFIALLIDFFVEMQSLGELANLTILVISTFFAPPFVLSMLPGWIILLASKEKKKLFPIINYAFTLVLFITCILIGWLYRA